MENTNNAGHILRQSAALPFALTPKGLQVLLITNKSQKKWLIPKGHLEPLLTEEASAAAEAFEEAGVTGIIGQHPLGLWICTNKTPKRHVVVYPMLVTEVHSEWPDQGKRRRLWLPIQRIGHFITSPQLQRVIKALPAFLDQTSYASSRQAAFTHPYS